MSVVPASPVPDSATYDVDETSETDESESEGRHTETDRQSEAPTSEDAQSRKSSRPSIRFQDDYTRESAYSERSDYTTRTDTTAFSKASLQSEGTHASFHSSSTYKNAYGVDVDLAGRGLAGLNIGGTEVVETARTPDNVRPERPSGLFKVHASRYEGVVNTGERPRKNVSFKGGAGGAGGTAASPTSGSRSRLSAPGSGGRSSSSRTSSSSIAPGLAPDRASDRSSAASLSPTSPQPRGLSRLSTFSRSKLWESSASGGAMERRGSSSRDSAASSPDALSRRSTSSLISSKRQSSFRNAQEAKSDFFGKDATVHMVGAGQTMAPVAPEDVELDVYVNDLEFQEDFNERSNESAQNSELFYRYQLLTERERLLMVKWLMQSFTEQQLKDLSEELGALVGMEGSKSMAGAAAAAAVPFVDGDDNTDPLSQASARNVALMLEQTDRMVNEKRLNELETVHQQRLQSVVEALVMKAHQKADEDMANTAVKHGKGAELLDVMKEDTKLRFYDIYETTAAIGRGHFSEVVLCNVRNRPNENFAVKVVRKGELSIQALRHLRTELRVVQLLKHVNLVRTVDIFSHWDYAYIVMEYVPGGTLLEVLNREKVFSEDDARGFMFEILRGVAHMHKFGIIHRDLKFENILCSSVEPPITLKIADFGLCHMVQDVNHRDEDARVARTDDREAYIVVKEALEGSHTDDKSVTSTVPSPAPPSPIPLDDEQSAVGTPVSPAAEGDENGEQPPPADGEGAVADGGGEPPLSPTPMFTNGDATTAAAAAAANGNGNGMDEEYEGHVVTAAVGTPAYAAPELLRGEPYSFGVDVWACGVILFGMLSGARPFAGTTPEKVLHDIGRRKMNFKSREWQNVSEQAKSLLRAMLEVNPQYRVTVEEAMRHTWFG